MGRKKENPEELSPEQRKLLEQYAKEAAEEVPKEFSPKCNLCDANRKLIKPRENEATAYLVCITCEGVDEEGNGVKSPEAKD